MRKSYLFALPMAIGLFGCNQQAPTPEPKPADSATTSQSTPAPESANDLPVDAPVVHVAMTGIDEPFTFKDEKGSLIGLEYDIMQAVGQSQGFKVDPIVISPSDLLSGLDAKNYDLVIAVMGYTDERASKYGVSKSYFSTPSAIMHIKPELTINSYKDLAGMNVAVGSGSFHEKDLKEMGTTKSLDTLDSTYLMFQGMVQGKYDAIVQDQTILQYTATKYPDVKTTISPYYADEKEGNDDVVMIMHKDNTELLEKINQGIDEIKANGKLDEISQKWLNAPAPK
ncbi:amino acid ABC transporter substrate-binding protein [Moraxella sp. K127]|uniref:ABC transporter substrate-binding protein n=1 Tax=Moraxella sp. K127 TaxID=2780079 RepID=UPI00187FE73D|nr:transporter substrate-binding domain-containing protein [Moraxella sp. K127]MBE9589855.1 amino acid ABC transporter substrate-binding protein [Moraxella sp. K127]